MASEISANSAARCRTITLLNLVAERGTKAPDWVINKDHWGMIKLDLSYFIQPDTIFSFWLPPIYYIINKMSVTPSLNSRRGMLRILSRSVFLSAASLIFGSACFLGNCSKLKTVGCVVTLWQSFARWLLWTGIESTDLKTGSTVGNWLKRAN